jgi:preprotein translocase subunit SecD
MSQQWKSRVYGLFFLIIFSMAALTPTITGFMYPDEEVLAEGFTKFFKNRLILGLDLQGGIHLQYKVDTRTALINKSANFALRLRDDIRNQEELAELKGASLTVLPVPKSELEGKSIDEVTQLTIRFDKEKDAKVFSSEVIGYLSKFYQEYEWISDQLDKNEIVVGMRRNAIEVFKEDALSQAIETIERRINAFGVAESSVSKRDDDKIVVELPGLNEKEFGKAKERLAQTGLLHFKIVEYNAAQNTKFFSKVRERDPRRGQWPEAIKELKQHKVYISGNTIRSTSLEILEYMVDNTLEGDIEHILGYEKLYVDPTDNTLSSIRRLSTQQEKQIDKEQKFDPNASVVKAYEVYYLRIEGMSGENVEDAQVGYDNFQRPVTNMRFSSADATEFANLTEKNVNQAMAILIDNIVYSAPNINERIGGGRVQISMGGGGNSVLKEAKALAAVLKSGALQAPLRQLYSSQVGPTLGQESIQAGKISIIVGFILVIIFMVLYYKERGVVANVALILNLLFIGAGLAIFGATLTLPGIAGIVLTVGMAVDANVLIFERMKEEERTKRTPQEAFVAGYEKAWSAILDANITTGIAAVVLYQFGTGPIKGFAVTLGLGIISSMYTAIVVTRLIFEYRNRQSPLASPSAITAKA